MNFCFTNEERKQIQDSFTNEIETNTPKIIKVLFSKKEFFLRVTLYPSENYPKSNVLTELNSKNLDEQLLIKLNLLCEKEAKKHIGKQHALFILQFLQKYINTNKLIFCYAEIMEIKKHLKKEDKLEINEKEGIIKLRVEEGGYFVLNEFIIPSEYPTQKITSRIIESNFPQDLITTLDSVVNTIPLTLKHPLQPKERSEKVFKAPSTSEIHDIKHDLQFLRKLSDLKEVAPTDKYVRRQKTVLVRKEMGMEIERENQEKKEKFNETSSPLSHLLLMCECLIDKWVHFLTRNNCKVCEQSFLQVDSTKYIPLERIYCGHFYHQKCLFDYLATPPIERKSCHFCKQTIYHVKWNEDFIKNKQKSQALKEAKEREIADVFEFLNIK